MKMKHFLWLAIASVVLGGLITLLLTTHQPDPATRPNILFDERVYDFGVVEPEDRPQHRFTFRNAGQVDLVISEVKPSCGCTAVLLSTETITPGGQGEIEVSLNPQERRGKQKLTVSVRSNAQNEPVVKLALRGTIKATVEVVPERVFFGSVNNQETNEKHVRILGAGDGKLQIIRVDTTSSFLTAEVLPPQSGRLLTYEVKVTLQPGSPVGKFKEMLIIHTNDEHRPRLDVSVEGNVLGPITVSPEHLFLGFVNPGEDGQRNLLLTKAGEANLKILEVGHQSQFVLTEILPAENKRKVQVQVKLSPNTPSGPFRDTLEIYTNNAEQPVIHVPLHALVRKK